MTLPRLLLVTDPRVSLARTEAVVRAVAGAVPAGAFGVQLRMKTASDDELRTWATSLRSLTQAEGAALFVNLGGPGDRLAVARDVGADGVHVPRDVRPTWSARPALVTMTAHDEDDVGRARDAGADAVLVSPIFASPGKGAPRGTAAVANAARVGVPVYALGGIDATNAAACFEAGATGVAVIRALLDAEDPAASARQLLARAPAGRMAPGGGW